MTYGRGRLAILAAGVVLGMATLAASASADGGVAVPGLSEQQMRKVETELLGSRHAAEHARQRAAKRKDARRWRALTAAQRRAARAKAASAERRWKTRARAADVSTDGRWSGDFVDLPTVAIHAALLPTNKILYFAYPDGENRNTARAWLWDIATGRSKSVDPPQRPGTTNTWNIWCGGQSLMADGRVLVTGGNLEYSYTGSGYQGLDKVFTFNPWTETWQQEPDMAHGRWYPTQTLLPDGSTLIVGGWDESGSDETNLDVELFTPPASGTGRGTVRRIGGFGAENGGPNRPGLYPHMFVLNTGNVLAAGPWKWDAWLFSRTAGGTASWTDRPDWDRDRNYGAALLLPGGPEGSSRVMQIGGYQGEESVATSLIADGARSGQPQAGPTLNVARSHTNVIAGPDGSLFAIGGGYGNRGGQQRLAGPEHRQVEILDPGSSTWRLGPSQFFKRAYHSTALLLPDGRIMSAGDDNDPDKTRTDPTLETDEAEFYEPPYLFAPGNRPVLESAPSQVGYGQAFTVGTREAVDRAVLIAPGATTHANDMSQRSAPLRLVGRGGNGQITFQAPANANVAVPGYYMLFLVSPTGKPSVARWVKLGDLGGPPPAGNPQQPPQGTTPSTPVTPVTPGNPPATTPPVGDTVKPIAAPSLTARLSSSGLRRTGALRVSVRTNRATRLSATAKVSFGGRTVRLRGVSSARLSANHSTTLTFRASTADRRRMARSRLVKVTVALSARDGAGRTVSRTLRAQLRR